MTNEQEILPEPPELSRIDLEPPGQTGESLQMAFLDYGGSGKGVVLLHATGFLPWLWHSVASAIARDHRVIVPCFFSHRPSDPHRGGLGWLQLAEDLRRLCVHLKLDHPVFVGHSMGATVAILAHTVQQTAAAGMVLIEPILLPAEAYRGSMPLDQHPLAAKAIRRKNHWPDRKAVWNDFKTKPFFRSWDPAVLALYVQFGIREEASGGVTLTCSPQQEASLFMGGLQHDPWPELTKVTCPAWVVEGEVSENRHWIDLRQVAGLIPGSRHINVPGAGHLVPMEKPVETIRLIRSFLKA